MLYSLILCSQGRLKCRGGRTSVSHLSAIATTLAVPEPFLLLQALENVQAGVCNSSNLLLQATRCPRIIARASSTAPQTLDRAPEKAARVKQGSSRPIRFAGEDVHGIGADVTEPGTRSTKQQSDFVIRHGGYLRELYIRYIRIQ